MTTFQNLHSNKISLAFMIAAAAAAVEPAYAAAFLDGAYGSKEGCIYAKTGESSGAEDFLLLNDEGLTTAMAFCEFKSAARKSANGFTIRAQCDAEGEVGPEQTATLAKTAKGYIVSFPDGTRWGPIARCR